MNLIILKKTFKLVNSNFKWETLKMKKISTLELWILNECEFNLKLKKCEHEKLWY